MADLLKTLKEVEGEHTAKVIRQFTDEVGVAMQKTFDDMIPTLRKLEDDLIAGMVSTMGPDAETLRPYFRQTIENEAKKKIISQVQEMVDKTLKK
jgi:hypothetical protein